MDNILTRFLRKIKFLAVVLLFTYSYQINAQCGTPVVGCPGTDFGNFGFNSNTDAATIEYDNFTSTFHTTVVRDANGNFQVWGEQIGHGATTTTTSNLLDPTEINTTNFPGFTGTPLKASLGGNGNNNVQGVLLTTTGLHVWGETGIVVAASLTTNWRMQLISPTGSNASGLPAGVTPAQVKMMFVTFQTIAITTCN